jgi:hypothetical protein
LTKVKSAEERGEGRSATYLFSTEGKVTKILQGQRENQMLGPMGNEKNLSEKASFGVKEQHKQQNGRTDCCCWSIYNFKGFNLALQK